MDWCSLMQEYLRGDVMYAESHFEFTAHQNLLWVPVQSPPPHIALCMQWTNAICTYLVLALCTCLLLDLVPTPSSEIISLHPCSPYTPAHTRGYSTTMYWCYSFTPWKHAYVGDMLYKDLSSLIIPSGSHSTHALAHERNILSFFASLLKTAR